MLDEARVVYGKGEDMMPSREDRHPVLSDEERTAYFEAREDQQREIGEAILKKLREETLQPGSHPRRILIEVAVEKGYPVQVVQEALWTLEARGEIQWEEGHFVAVEEADQS